MALSAFTDKLHRPDKADLRATLGRAHASWERLEREVAERIGPVDELWAFTKSTGWGMRLRHEERVILYMTPQAGQFLVSLALGEKAVSAAEAARLPAAILDAIRAAPRYAEGRGVRMTVKSSGQLAGLAELASIKRMS